MFCIKNDGFCIKNDDVNTNIKETARRLAAQLQTEPAPAKLPVDSEEESGGEDADPVTFLQSRLAVSRVSPEDFESSDDDEVAAPS